SETDVKAGKDRKIARRPEMKHPFAQPRLDDAAGHIARTHDRVIGLGRHAEPLEYPLDRGARARRVGDEDHGAAFGAKARQRLASGRKSGNTVVDHAPDVAQKNIVVACERSKSFDNLGHTLSKSIAR